MKGEFFRRNEQKLILKIISFANVNEILSKWFDFILRPSLNLKKLF